MATTSRPSCKRPCRRSPSKTVDPSLARFLGPRLNGRGPVLCSSVHVRVSGRRDIMQPAPRPFPASGAGTSSNLPSLAALIADDRQSTVTGSPVFR
jgi:hypothetical protein